MNDSLFNLLYFILSAITLPLILLSTIAGLIQLVRLKKEKKLEFIKIINERLFDKERFDNRKAVYKEIPQPFTEPETFKKWIAELTKRDKRNEKKLDDITYKLEKELEEFELVSIYLKEGKLDKNVFFSNWFDVLSRFSVLATDWIITERIYRGKDWLQNTEWLFNENLKYIKSRSFDKIYFYKEENGKRIHRDITKENIEFQLNKLMTSRHTPA